MSVNLTFLTCKIFRKTAEENFSLNLFSFINQFCKNFICNHHPQSRKNRTQKKNSVKATFNLTFIKNGFTKDQFQFFYCATLFWLLQQKVQKLGIWNCSKLQSKLTSSFTLYSRDLEIEHFFILNSKSSQGRQFKVDQFSMFEEKSNFLFSKGVHKITHTI